MKLPILKRTHLLYIGIVLGAFLFGAACTWLLIRLLPQQPAFTSIHEDSSPYHFINPLLFLQVPESAALPEYSRLKSAIAASVAAHPGTVVSVYFRNLDSNQWIGVNETEKFSPASMLKVATLISVLREGETKPALLTANITVLPSTYQAIDSQDFYAPKDPILPNATYSVSTLMQHLIIDSDNNANVLLLSMIGDAAFRKTFTDLVIPIPDSSAEDADTARDYSHLFRVLYNATYLSPTDSEEALQLLSRTTFTDGLVAGVPSGTVVSHKFGERSVAATPTDPAYHELHDCGIVYYPENPYFLCVMTKGSDFPSLASAIQDVSSVAWQQVSALAKK